MVLKIPEASDRPERSTTESLFDKFIVETSREQQDWSREMIAYTLNAVQEKQDRYFYQLAAKYRQDNHLPLGPIEEMPSLVMEGKTAVRMRSEINEQVQQLRTGNDPQELQLLVKEMTEKAWELRASPGMEEARVEMMNRMMLASFVKFIFRNGYRKIGLTVADMDGLKAFNNLSDRLGDCGLLSVFYAGEKATKKHGGLIFITNEGGGDDFASITVGEDINTINQIPEEINQILTNEVGSIESFTQETILGQPNRFSSTGESKQLTRDEIRTFQEKVGNRQIKPPQVTALSIEVDLSNSTEETVVDDFFRIYNEQHQKIGAIKDTTKGKERGSIIPFLGDPIVI